MPLDRTQIARCESAPALEDRAGASRDEKQGHAGRQDSEADIVYPKNQKSLSPEALLEILDVKKIHPECDLRRILRRATSDDSSAEIALGPTQEQNFKNWRMQNGSAALFVENTMRSPSDNQTPFTFTSLASSYFIETVRRHSICV